MKKSLYPKLGLIASMTVFGTIGIFVKYIPIPSSIIAMIRGFIGMIFLLSVILARRSEISWGLIKKKFIPLFFSSTFIGINWILLFESYRYTTVATATLCYYLAPIFVILASPIVLGERLTAKKLVCVFTALVGMVFVSGILGLESFAFSEIKGILLGIGAAIFYASVILLNKKLADIPTFNKTFMQLGIAAIVLLPYTLITENFGAIEFTLPTVILLLIVGIVHTGISYALYFGAIGKLPSHTVAIFSYIDPIVAIVLSALFLREPMDIFGVIGAVMILSAAFISEMPDKK